VNTVVLHVPHAGVRVPGWARPDRLDDAGLAAEVAALTDHRTDVLARAAADDATGDAVVLVNDVSRFVVDVERFPDAREPMRAVGMGAVYTHGTRGQRIRSDDPAHEAALLDAFYRPWARRVEQAVRAALVRGPVVLLDVHSYPRDPLPYERGAGERPEVCLGTDARHTPAWLLAAAREAFAGFGTACDTPFAGTYVPLALLGDARVASVMLEVRRDVHGAREAELVAALRALVGSAARGPAR
jgi:N-formylglutamate amidohydrolase